jgi:adenosine deaminase
VRNITNLPKAHLHLHLEASARPSTIAELAARKGVAYTLPTRFASFAEFDAAYKTMAEFIAEPADLVRICREVIADEAAQGVAYTQPMFVPRFYAERFGMKEEEAFALMRDAFMDAAVEHGIDVGFILAGIWTRPIDTAEATARFAAAHADQGVVAFGLAGVEPAGGYARWARACDIARDAGLLVVPHAGEFGGAGNVAEAMDDLRADRIAHGVQAIDDPNLVARLASAGIACDICPTSNAVLGVFPSLGESPVRVFLEAGVPFTLNTDDQLFFGKLLAEEYAMVRDAFALSDAELAAIAHTSVAVSGAPATTKARIHQDIDAWLDGPA